MRTYELRAHPKLKAFVKAAFPGYRKMRVGVALCENITVEAHSTMWQDGSKSSFHLANLSGSEIDTLWGIKADERGNRLVRLGNGKVLVETGIFCGKPATMYIFVNPDDVETLGV